MNAKEKNIARFYDARTAHFKWLNNVKLLVSGFEIDREILPPIIQDTDFGKWFYKEGLQFSHFYSKNVLGELEEILESMFGVFSKIYVIYYNFKKSRMKTFLGIRNVPTRYEKEMAARHYEELVALSDTFKKRLQLLESQLLAMSEEKHAMIHRDEEELVQKVVSQDTLEGHYHGPRSH